MNDRQRLLQLLPWARAEVKKTEGRVELETDLVRSQLQYITEENLGGIAIYPGSRGGWHCDLVLTKVPPGVPNALGSQKDRPLPTRAAAEDHAKMLLVVVLKLMALPKEHLPPVFLFYDFVVDLNPALLQAAISAGKVISQDAAGRLLTAFVREHLPNGEADFEALVAAPHVARYELIRTVHIAAISGVSVYPLRDAAPPPPLH